MKLSKLTRWLPLGEVPEIDAQALYASMGSGESPRIIDVRTSVEWRKSRIVGAVNIPVTELGSRVWANCHLAAMKPLS